MTCIFSTINASEFSICSSHIQSDRGHFNETLIGLLRGSELTHSKTTSNINWPHLKGFSLASRLCEPAILNEDIPFNIFNYSLPYLIALPNDFKFSSIMSQYLACGLFLSLLFQFSPMSFQISVPFLFIYVGTNNSYQIVYICEGFHPPFFFFSTSSHR